MTLLIHSFKKIAMTVILSRTFTMGISLIAHFTISSVADRPSLLATKAISQAARGLITSHNPSDASNTSLSSGVISKWEISGSTESPNILRSFPPKARL